MLFDVECDLPFAIAYFIDTSLIYGLLKCHTVNLP